MTDKATPSVNVVAVIAASFGSAAAGILVYAVTTGVFGRLSKIEDRLGEIHTELEVLKAKNGLVLQPSVVPPEERNTVLALPGVPGSGLPVRKSKETK